MMTPDVKPYRWGILGTSAISQKFATSLTHVNGAIKQAVFSRDRVNVKSFSQEFGFPSFYYNLDEFFKDPLIDIVYIATPTRLHFEHCLMAINSHKAILCEKPFTLSWEEAQEIIKKSKENGVFCMEAMWLRFNPFIQRCKHFVEQKEIGEICSTSIEIGYRKDVTSLGKPEDGMGTMHRFGCYGLSLAYYLWGAPRSQKFDVIRTNTGVDINCAVLLGYPTHTVSIIAGINGTHSNEVYIVGTEGSIKIPAPFFDATCMKVSRFSEPQINRSKSFVKKIARKLDRFSRPFKKILSRHSSPNHEGSGLRGEAEEVMRCLTSGLLESPLMSHNDSISIHQLLDEIRCIKF